MNVCPSSRPVQVTAPFIMRFLVLFVVVVFFSTVFAENDEEEDEYEDWPDFHVEILHKPEGCEEVSKNEKSLTFDYIARLHDDINQGLEFDSSIKQGKKMVFTMGEHMVMKGWEEGLKDMCIGEKRKLFIPPGEMQEGDKGTGALIPGNDVALEYEFELLDVGDKPLSHPRSNIFKVMDTNGDMQLTKDEMLRYFVEYGLGGLKDDETMDDAVDMIFRDQDGDKNGHVSYEEFVGPKHDEL
ncbi:uncharacterized protein LOC100370208 isoform X2 [Saccoglossus kowalevskii]